MPITSRLATTAVFLDRDGVIIEKAPEGQYVANWSEVRFLPGALASIAALSKAGFKIVIVTNQRGLSLGKIRAEDLDDIHRRMTAEFAASGIAIAGLYFCPHDKDENCDCRKPAPGMLLRAAEDLALDLDSCWMVGDSVSDIEAGKRAGCRTILIDSAVTGKAQKISPDLVVTDLRSAAQRILQASSAIPQHPR